VIDDKPFTFEKTSQASTSLVIVSFSRDGSMKGSKISQTAVPTSYASFLRLKNNLLIRLSPIVNDPGSCACIDCPRSCRAAGLSVENSFFPSTR